MLPQSHVVLAKTLSDLFESKYKHFFILGNVTPDFTPEHKLKKHEYHYLKDWLVSYLEKTLEMKIGDKRLAYYRLGVVTHYLSDFFCRAHNDTHIKKRYVKHFAYEKVLHNKLVTYDFDFNYPNYVSILKLDQILEEQHTQYLENCYHTDNDLKFINKITSKVVNSASEYIDSSSDTNLCKLELFD